ncbi:MAG: family 10 glycosylhydrolase [Planctomycetota bacterium]
MTTPQEVTRRQAITAIAGTALAAAGCSAQTRGTSASVRTNASEFRGAWVATVNNIDWPSAPGLTSAEQRLEVNRIVEKAADIGLNAIFLQVRPTADAIYPAADGSGVREPWSAFLTGASGRAPSHGYDPLEYWIERCRANSIELHAWINPYRARHPRSIGRDAATHVTNLKPSIVRTYGPYKWLDPGLAESREYILSVVEDLLRRYDVQGLHVDDYFYPYPRQGESFPDAATHRRFGRGQTLADWRRSNVDTLVQQLHETTRSIRPTAKFTISPFGIWRPDHPKGVKGLDAYNRIYADSRKWLREGWCDAMMPQLYWPTDSPGQPFAPLLDWWFDQRTTSNSPEIWPGLYLTRIKPNGESPSWEPGEITRQIDIIRERTAARTGSGGGSLTPGFALFSMIGMTEDRRGVNAALKRTIAKR